MKFPRAFTLIELLVVIAIIGLLSSIILAGLSSARSKGSDAAGISEMKAIRNAAELYYTQNSNYGAATTPAGSCTGVGAMWQSTANNINVLNVYNAILADVGGTAAGYIDCGTTGLTGNPQQWAIAARFPSGTVYCIDSSGWSGSTMRTSPGTAYGRVSPSGTGSGPKAKNNEGDTFCN
ncbi:MAG TPA: type II secretion system protein [Candidatus Paceibacterota bacterium]|nr:type II secretion system protein [Candidatus Paceibacterota bacterium]